MPVKVKPPIDPIQKHEIKTDFEQYVKAYFGVEITEKQMELCKAVIDGKPINSYRLRGGLNIYKQWVQGYVYAGMDKHGRERIATRPLPPTIDMKGKTQQGKILAMIERPGGAFNFELSRYALKYTSVISELRKDGYHIVAERQHLKNGKASNTWKYYIGGRL